ncbi:MAG TPA: HAMP domain-containing sensor histidine kinase [Gemmataceae bacterium]|nr:HAMP domain-containing sensor histidine kinase [Gemmataceae bacterium]
MSFERLKTFVQTLRFRLTLWNTTVVLVLLVVNLAAIRTGLEYTQTRLVDEFLNEEMDSAVLDWNQLREQPVQLHLRYDQRATGHPRRQLFVQILDDHGRLAWSSEQAPARDILPPSILVFGRPARVGEYRIVCRQMELPDGPSTTLRVGCWLGRAQEDLQRFSNILLTAGILLLLLAPLGGYLLAYRATRPIAHIIRVTNRLHPGQLEERLPIRGSHDELDQVSQTINDLLDRIAAYLRQSREFTANAAHELRSPLTALQSSLEIALNTERTTEEYKEVLAVLLEECGQMRVLINQLLFLAEADSGRLRLHSQPLRLDQIIANSLEMFQVVAESAGVELTARRVQPVVIHGDGSRLWQVVNNLVDNAIKFTPAQGQVSLDFYLDEERHQCVLEVSDTGAGISPRDLPNIFERFYQSDKARQRENPARGLGLGLSICQAVVTAHGGTIAVASTLGKGTTFAVRLPDCKRPGPDEMNSLLPSTPSTLDDGGIGESA